MSPASENETDPPKPPRNRFRKGQPKANPVYRNVADHRLRALAKSAGKELHPGEERHPAQRFRHAFQNPAMPDGPQRSAATHSPEAARKTEPTHRARISAAYKHREAEDFALYSSEDLPVSRKKKPVKRAPGLNRGASSSSFSSASSGNQFHTGQRRAKGPHGTAALHHARPRPPQRIKPVITPLTRSRTPAKQSTRTDLRRFPATRNSRVASYSETSSPRSRSSCSDYSLSELDSDNSRRQRRRPRRTLEDRPNAPNASSSDTHREPFSVDNVSNSTSETYSSGDDDSSETEDFAGLNEHRLFVKPELTVNQSSDSFTESDEDLSASSVSSGYQNVARQLHRRRCKDQGGMVSCVRPYLSSKREEQHSDTPGQAQEQQRSLIPLFGSETGRGQLHDVASDSETDSAGVSYDTDSYESHCVSRRFPGKQSCSASSARGFDGALQLHIVGRKTRQRPQKPQLYTVLSSGSEQDSLYYSASSGTDSSRSRTRGLAERFGSRPRLAQKRLGETTPFDLLQQMEKLSLHETPEPIASQLGLARPNQPQSPKLVYPRVSFSVTYKAPLNAKYVLFVCGSSVELGSSLIPSRVGYRGVPLEEDPDGIGCTDFWRSDPVEIRSVPPGTDIYYTYYVMDEAKVNSANRKDRYQVAYQERLLPGTTKKLPNSVPLDTKGARCFRLPNVLNRFGANSNTQGDRACYRMADYRFGDVSRKGRFTQENTVEHRRDSSDSGSDSPDF